MGNNRLRRARQRGIATIPRNAAFFSGSNVPAQHQPLSPIHSGVVKAIKAFIPYTFGVGLMVHRLYPLYIRGTIERQLPLSPIHSGSNPPPASLYPQYIRGRCVPHEPLSPIHSGQLVSRPAFIPNTFGERISSVMPLSPIHSGL